MNLNSKLLKLDNADNVDSAKLKELEGRKNGLQQHFFGSVVNILISTLKQKYTNQSKDLP